MNNPLTGSEKPHLRVLFERNWAALRAALRQDLILFLLVCALSWVILHASSWSLDESGTFCLHWKLLFRFDRTVRGASLVICMDIPQGCVGFVLGSLQALMLLDVVGNKKGNLK